MRNLFPILKFSSNEKITFPNFTDPFWNNVDIKNVDDCWTWKKGHSGGYGSIGKGPTSHRIAFFLFYGFYPEVVDHKICSNKGCQNPYHMEASTIGKNASREQHEKAMSRTHCINGHEFTEENTYVRKNNSKTRVCKTCRRKGMQHYNKKYRY